MIVEQAKKKVNLWILICTVGGIALLTAYITVLIPSVTREIVFWTLLWCAPPTLSMIGYHKVLMDRRWRIAERFLEEGEEKSEITPRQALSAIMDFPALMPQFGFVAWVIGGLGALFGAFYATQFKLLWTDGITLYIGILAGALIITIFQFFLWRQILDPVAGAIIHRAPSALDGEIGVVRTPLQRSLLLSLIPLIILSLFIAEMAGYRQAATTLQNWVGVDHLDKVKETSDKIPWAQFGDPAVRAAAFTQLKNLKNDSLNVYLVEDRGKDGDWELIQDVPVKTIFPDVVMREVRKVTAATPENRNFQYNPFIPEMNVAQKVVVGQGDAAKEYFLIFGYPWKNYSSQLHFFIFISIVLMLVVVGLSSGVVLVIARDISSPVHRLVEFTEEVAQGKIHGDVFFHAHDEVGDLALSLRHMSDQLGTVLARIGDAAGSLDQATGGIQQASESVKDGAKLQDQAIEDVASSMTEMDATIQGIADNVEVLSASAEESSSSIFEMGAAIKKINESVDVLNLSINEVSSSINEMTAALDQVAENVGNLSAVAEETASGMSQMDASIREVEQNSKETAEWSQSVIQDSEAGVDAVSQVTRGMSEIAKVVHTAQEVIERLAGRVEEIGKIVQVIDDVANQTNLLALNAAIIAAQAGEHGRGFAVVADEIKQLAERTSGSTREIHQLIRGVQEESRQAVGAVEDGARAVEAGVQLTDQASQSLAKIMEGSKTATERVQVIAQTTVEQAESSRQISAAIDRVAEMVGQISVATQEQAKGGSLILKATDEMKTASLQVKRNAEEQLQGSRLITKSIENITDMLYSINQSQQEQKKNSSHVVQLMERIKVVSQKNVDSAGRLSDVLSALSHEADVLREELQRFEYRVNKDEPGKNGA